MISELIRRLLSRQSDSRRVEIVPDRVWISATARLEGIRAELDQLVAQSAPFIALVAHFPDVLRTLEDIASGYTGASSVRALLARQLTAGSVAELPLGDSAALELVVAERHPLASEDLKLVRFAEALPCRCRVVHHLSLEDPLLLRFGAESLRPLLARLGANGDEPITHPFIAQSIGRAQARIAADVFGHYDADSAAEWLEQNARH